MTPISTVNLLRVLFVMLAAFVGITIGGVVFSSQWVGLFIGLLYALVLVLADRLLKGFTLRAFSAATFGLLLGLVFANLLRASRVLVYLPADWEWGISIVIYLTFAYLGMMLAIRSNRDEFSLIIPYVRFSREAVQDEPLLVDTNIVIDGRVTDVCGSGFLSGSLVVPRFVLAELQRLADSSDPVRRERGRRGFDNINQMQKTDGISVTIHETLHEEGEHEMPVDTLLIQLAKRLPARLLTNDANLCKVARLQSIRVLNLNDLAKAMRPVVMAGDDLELALVKEGRDSHQAVGYLADGTMIVVNNGRPHIGKTVNIIVAGTLLTSAGRLIFAELKA